MIHFAPKHRVPAITPRLSLRDAGSLGAPTHHPKLELSCVYYIGIPYSARVK
jgi:hypothetical protein